MERQTEREKNNHETELEQHETGKSIPSQNTYVFLVTTPSMFILFIVVRNTCSCFALLNVLFTFAVLVPLDEVKAEWERTSGPYHKHRIAKHYGLYRDLFDNATFVPQVLLGVNYNQDEEHVVPVYYGNIVTPSEVL